MNKVISISMAVVVLFTVISTLKAFRDLNDGRVLTVVKQLVQPQVLEAKAVSVKRIK